MSNKNTVGSAFLLLGASLIWGTAFVAQSAGMRYIGPFTFSAVRGMLAALFLLPLSFLMERKEQLNADRAGIREEIKAGLILGVLVFFAANLQQLGLQFTSAGKAGFITSLYIVIVPIFGLFQKKRMHPILWLCVLIALAGFYVLSINGQFSIGRGDLMVLICAVFFALQILSVDRFAPRMNVVRLCCMQFFIMSLLSVPFMLILEKPQIANILSAWLTLVYAGVISGGVAYTMQMFAQRHMDPAAASILCSSEAMFALLAGWILLHERMSIRELIGCALVFLAVVCSQLPWGSFRKRKNMI